MNSSNLDTPAVSVKKNKASKPMKTFWGLIGLLAVSATGLIAMAGMALNEHSVETVKKVEEPGVEIMDLGGQSRIVSSGQLPAKPFDVDESKVVTGSEDADDKTTGKSETVAVKVDKEAGKKLVESVAVAEPVKPKKEAVVQEKKVEAVAKNQVSPREKPAVSHDAHMDILF